MIRLLATIVFACTFVSNHATSAPHPEQDSVYLNDFADALDAETRAELGEHLKRIRETHGIEMTVVTINTFEDFDPAESWEDFATRMFDGCGIGARCVMTLRRFCLLCWTERCGL